MATLIIKRTHANGRVVYRAKRVGFFWELIGLEYFRAGPDDRYVAEWDTPEELRRAAQGEKVTEEVASKL